MNEYKEKLKNKMDAYVHWVYKVTKQFPQSELYGSTSQFRRASMSIVLNYIEGYARKKNLVQLNFYETSFGSYKESRYLIDFAYVEGWISEEDKEVGVTMAEEIGAMLWRDLEQQKDYAHN